MTDVLGPADAGAVNAVTTTTDVTNPTAGDTWFQDCVANNPATGTNLPSRFMNKALQQLRRIIRLSGVPQSNANDDMLGQAIQSGALNWVGFFGGSANAPTGTMNPVPLALIPGLRIGGFVAASNTGAATFNLAGLGGVPILTSEGAPLTGGELTAGALVSMRYEGTAFRIESQWPLAFLDLRYLRILIAATTFFVNNSVANSSGDLVNDGKTAGTAWFSIANAIKKLSTYSLDGNTITIQLALTGVDYIAPTGAFSAPSGGTTVINGDPAAQGSYTIAGSPGNGGGVIACVGGALSLVGLTLANDGGIPGSANLAISCSVTIQNVTFAGTGAANTSHIVSNPGGTVRISSGCIWAKGGATGLFSNGGQIIQAGNCTVTGTPTFTTAFNLAWICGTFQFAAPGGWTWTGAANGPRYSVAHNGVIATNGAGPNFFPGSSAGLIASGGDYS